MKTVTVTGYEYHELSDKVKERLASAYIDGLSNEEWWYDFLEEEFKEEAAKAGYSIAEVRFSGFWNQGDGASFSACVYPIEWLRARGGSKNYWRLFMNLIRGRYHLDIWISFNTQHYCHSNTMTIDFDLSGDAYWHDTDFDALDELNRQAAKLVDEIISDARQMAKDFYRTLEKEWESITSESAIDEEFKQMGHTYTAGGYVLDTN